MAAHGGTIAVADTSSAGTTFRVALPAAHVPVGGAAPRTESGGYRARSPLAGLRVLFVDDEPALRSSMEAYATLRGFTVITAVDGIRGLEAAQQTSFDAVVCDLRMPGLDGPAFHERLRATLPGLAARTAFITGDVVSTATRGATRQPIVAKPFAFEQLEDVLVALIRGGAAALSLRATPSHVPVQPDPSRT